MFPDDRVLVAYVPSKADWQRVAEEKWYRIPYLKAPADFQTEYFAFYFGKAFGPKKHAIHYYAPLQGHELVQRRDLFPEQPDHPRAEAWYYKIQLGDIRALPRPIVSRKWRRLVFALTDWYRFCRAKEVSDLFGDPPLDVSSRGKQLREPRRWP